MDSYFPELDGIFSNMFSQGARIVLSKSPLPFKLKRKRQDLLTQDIQGASRRGERAARTKAPVGIALGQEAASFQVRSLVHQMDLLDEECAKV